MILEYKELETNAIAYIRVYKVVIGEHDGIEKLAYWWNGDRYLINLDTLHYIKLNDKEIYNKETERIKAMKKT